SQQLADNFPHVPEYQNNVASTLTNLASLLQQRRAWTDAREMLDKAKVHHLAALQGNPKHPTYCAAFATNRRNLCALLVDLGDHAAAAATAQELAQAAVNPTTDYYDAAMVLAACVSLVEKDERLAQERRQLLAEEYAAQSLKVLRQGIEKGFRNGGLLKQERAF